MIETKEQGQKNVLVSAAIDDIIFLEKEGYWK